MKFKISYTDESTGEVKELQFLRTLGTEKTYKDNLSTDEEQVEFAKDLTAILLTFQDFQEAIQTPKDKRTEEDKDVITRVLSLQFREISHNILKYSYAKSVEGRLIQNESTREAFDEIENLPEIEVLGAYFRKSIG